ncbi:MAG: hypothetical protein IPK16_01070 [Anaerolineales bacterium]|nr:hypothetical protein [Anaerolineales bacterium]
MPREVTIALVQMAPALANPEANLRKMGDFIEKICGEQKTDLIVFPELSYTGHELGLRATDLAERVPGHATNYLAKRQRIQCPCGLWSGHQGTRREHSIQWRCLPWSRG